MNRVGKWTLLALIMCAAPVLAQLDCPSIVQAALDATDEQCSATGRNQACYGNINLEAIPQAGVEEFIFNAPGDMVAVSAVESLSLSSRVAEAGEWGIALLQLQANLPDSLPEQNVIFLLFGAVEIENAVETNVEPITFNVTAQGDSRVHSGPSAEDTEITVLTGGEMVTAIGRNADSSWVQIALPDGSTGWVAAEGVVSDGDIRTLNMTAPVLTPMQAFYFSSGTGDAPCAEAPDSGILVQTPEGAAQIQFLVNDVSITLGSTAYLQAQPGGNMTTSVAEGQAAVEAGGASVVVPAGSQVSVPLDAQGRAAGTPSQPQPYDPAKMAVLPVRILPRAITIAAPISGGSTAGGSILLTAGEWTWTAGTPSAEGCQPGVLEFVIADFTPDGTFRLPGGEFSWETFYEEAYGQSPPPESVFSNPEPNTYVMDIPIPQFSWLYEARVIDSEHVEGAFSSVGSECSIVIPFEMAGESAAGIIPAAGEWEWTMGAPSEAGCAAGTAAFVASVFTPRGPFQLPGDEFSLPILFDAAFGESDLPAGVYSNPDPNTYIAGFTDPGGSGQYTVRVVDTSSLEGLLEYTSQGCTITIPFEVTRIGD